MPASGTWEAAAAGARFRGPAPARSGAGPGAVRGEGDVEWGWRGWWVAAARRAERRSTHAPGTWRFLTLEVQVGVFGWWVPLGYCAVAGLKLGL